MCEGMLRTVLVGSILAANGLLAGCAGLQAPQNADEFRSRVSAQYIETQDIHRPFVYVAAAITRKAGECFNASFDKEYIDYNGPYALKRRSTLKYTGTVITSKSKATIAVQFASRPRRQPNWQNEPANGLYLLVADAYPHGNGTRLELYGTVPEYEPLHSSIKEWANGTKLKGCPELSSMMN